MQNVYIERTLKIVIADDHPIVREGLKAFFQRQSFQQFSILGEFGNGQELSKSGLLSDCDLLILDLNLEKVNGLDVIETIKARRNAPRILVFSRYKEPRLIKSAFRKGADAYVLKDAHVSDLMEGIRQVLRNERYLGQGVVINESGNGVPVSTINGNGTFEDRFVRKYNLTKRELEILHLITQALSNKEIAKRLFISYQTVSVHRKNIMRKMGVSNTAGLIKTAYENSLV